MGACEGGHVYDYDNDKRDHAPAGALWLSYGVLGVQFGYATLDVFSGYLWHPFPPFNAARRECRGEGASISSPLARYPSL